MNSAIYTGQLRHRRFLPREHIFSYALYMLWLDLDELPLLDQRYRYFACERFAPLTWRRSDYLTGVDVDPTLTMKDAVLHQVTQLGGESDNLQRVCMLGQVRCFGIYFSPINIFFCYDNCGARYALVEVHNTPWYESHCYLVDLVKQASTPKALHVSPFMGMDMVYCWRLRPPAHRALLHIESWREQKWFDATLFMHRHPFDQRTLVRALRRWPLMTAAIVRGIYWQALRLFIKRMKFFSHP